MVREADVARRTCMDATRKATWQSLRGPRGAQVAWTHGRRPRGPTRVLADACEGRHMARGLACEGPTG